MSMSLENRRVRAALHGQTLQVDTLIPNFHPIWCFFTFKFKFFKKLIKFIEKCTWNHTNPFNYLNTSQSVYPVAYSFSGDLEFLVGRPVSCDRCNPATGNGNSLCHRAGDFTYWPNISWDSLNYFPIWPFIQKVMQYMHSLPPEAEFLDEIQTKVLRVFLLAMQCRLYSFALRFIFLPNHATSYSFYCALLYTVKEK